MPSGCCIKNCKTRWHNAASKNIQLHRFPRGTTVRQQWLDACQRKESDIKVDAARVCSIHFEENCFAVVNTKPKLKNQPVKETLRLKKGSIPTKFLNLEKKQRRRMSQSKEDNKKIKVLGKSFVSTELVQYAQRKQRLTQDETVTKMETDVAQNTEEAVKNTERDTLQDTKQKVTKNIDKVATQNVEEQSNAIKQQVKQGIDRVDDNVMQLRIEQQLNQTLLVFENPNLVERNQKLLDENENLEKRIQELSTQVSQLQAEIKNMIKNKHKEAKTVAIAILRKCIEKETSRCTARAVSSL